MKLDFDTISSAVDELAPEMFDFIAGLVKIPSLPGNEGAAQEKIAEKLKQLGLAVEIVPCDFEELKRHPAFCDDGFPLDSRYNVVGRWAPAGAGPKSRKNGLMLNGHVDVVSPGDESLWRDSPWSGIIRDGKLYGRGSCDMKAGLAAGMFAIQALQALGFRPSKGVCLQSVVGEESGGVGTLAAIIKGFRAEGVIIMEPTGLDICPVEKFVPIMAALNELDLRRHKGYSHPLFPDPSSVAPLSIGTVRAGDWPSTVPDELAAEGRFGIFPGESITRAREAFVEAVMAAAKKDSWLKDHSPVIEWFEGQFESGETALEEPLLLGLQKVHREVTGNDAVLRGVTYGSDLRLFTNHASMPAALYGPGSIMDAHTANEHIDLEEVVLCAKVLAGVIAECCGSW